MTKCPKPLVFTFAAGAVISCIILICFPCVSLCFNVDTKFAIVYQDPGISQGYNVRGSYFGYSIALHNRTQDPSRLPTWLLVGAPRANSTLGIYSAGEIPEPGVIFKCSFGSPRGKDYCEEVAVDKTGNDLHVINSEDTYKDRKDHGWVGGAVDVQNTPSGRSMTCGFRWSNHRFPYHYLMNGVCYWMGKDLTQEAHKVIPLVRKSKQSLLAAENASVYYYSYGQAGISTHFPENNNEVLIGAPGVFTGKGTVIRYRDSKDLFPGSVNRKKRESLDDEENFSDVNIPNPHTVTEIDFNDYFGYSVSSGNFFKRDETNYVAGVPRGAEGKGKVIIFDYPPYSELSITVRIERTGNDMGEYYGAAVTGIDFNSDGLSDLVVGAPLYALRSEGYDMGRIYVYTNKGGGILEENPALIMGARQTRARFGAAVVNIGDINHDGYADLAVGAPYENGHGAVYIFMGSSAGLLTYPTEVIQAKEILPQLIGFGMSISKGQDMDNNLYPDIAVGSFISGHAVLLRTRPVVTLRGQLTSSTSKIDINSTEPFTVEACISYSGNYVPETVDVDVTLSMDSLFAPPRGVMETKMGEVSTYSYVELLKKGVRGCERVKAKIRFGIRDFIKPIQFLLTFTLRNSPPLHKNEPKRAPPPTSIGRSASLNAAWEEEAETPPDTETVTIVDSYVSHTYSARSKRQASFTFCKSCPVLDQNVPLSIVKNLAFQKNCGADDICTADLKLSTGIRRYDGINPIVIGSSKTLFLDVNITNKGEPAYLSIAKIHLPKPLRLVRILQSCHEAEENKMVIITCDVGNPIMPQEQVSFSLELDADGIRSGTTHLDIHVEVYSSSDELPATLSDNKYNITLPLATVADLGVDGRSTPETQLYLVRNKTQQDNEPDKERWITVKHQYEVSKYNASPIYFAETVFKFPVNISLDKSNPVPFVRILRPRAFVSSSPVQCAYINGKFHVPEELSKSSSSSNLNLTSGSIDFLRRRKRQVTPVGEVVAHENGTYTINCTDHRYKCAELRCSVGPFIEGASARFDMTVQINMEIFDSVMGKSLKVFYSSFSSVTILGLPASIQGLNTNPDEAFVTTQLIHGGPLPPQKVATWIIVLAVLGGILLLSLITAGLVKLGFFKRAKKEELDMLKQGTVAESSQLIQD